MTITLLLSASAAFADGFKAHDLTTVESIVVDRFAKADHHWATPSDMSISCCETEEDAILSVTLDRQTFDMGQEQRTDEAYIMELERSCALVGCEIEKIDVGSATARLLQIPSLGGGYKGANIFVVSGGDRLTIKSAAKTVQAARTNAMKVLEALKEPIIGH
ncbi:hypothetical protein ACVCNR_14930 [Aquamicrobium terrae]